jgi:hypothetical protein
MVLYYYYTYYSYEEWGRGYIGSRECKCLPENDIGYFGSYTDKTFNPTQKIILGTYKTREEAFAAEIILHEFYDVANNPHFANRSRLTTTKFCPSKESASKGGKLVKEQKLGIFSLSPEERKINCSDAGKKGGKITHELKVGVHSITLEERSKIGKKSIEKQKKEKLGLFSLTKEQQRENGKRNYELGIGLGSMSFEDRSNIGKKTYELGIGIHSLTTDQRRNNGKRNYENNIGFAKLSKEDLSQNGKKGGKNTSSQRWQCTETGFVSTPSGLTKYQKNRNIDILRRKRIV